jgi:transcriptional regulator with XRE-family HTH domain
MQGSHPSRVDRVGTASRQCRKANPRWGWTRSRRGPDDKESFAFKGTGSLPLIKNPLYFRLGQALRSGRKALELTQADVASAAHCSLPSVAQAELGRGGSALFGRLAKATGQELTGRSLPNGEVGAGLAALRLRRGLSRATVAEMAAVSIPTVTAVEAGSNVRMPGLAAVASALSAGLRLSAVGTEPAYWTGPATSSAHNGWTTPPEILDKLYDVVGGRFSLDPCSPTADKRRAPVRAQVHLTAADDGLAHDWHGTVYCNPPYGRGIGAWTAKCRASVQSCDAQLVIALLPARSDTTWWHRDVAGHADVFLLRGRLSFGDGIQSAPFPSALAGWGLDDDRRRLMMSAFPDAWHVKSS